MCCRAQAAAPLRHMQSGLRTLERRQAVLEKALAALQAPWSAPAPGSTRSRCPSPRSLPRTAHGEQYATIHPDRAARIRALRGLPAPDLLVSSTARSCTRSTTRRGA
jgi:hypothetical protein